MQNTLVRTLVTDASLVGLLARLALGIVILPHGLQKVFGWFGGYGFDATMGFFTQTMGIPAPLALAAVLAESLGAMLLIAGGASRLAAAAIGITMAVAALTSHLANGFFMNWYGNQAGEGFEFHILAIGLAAVVLVSGGGRWSADGIATRRWAGRNARQRIAGSPVAA